MEPSAAESGLSLVLSLSRQTCIAFEFTNSLSRLCVSISSEKWHCIMTSAFPRPARSDQFASSGAAQARAVLATRRRTAHGTLPRPGTLCFRCPTRLLAVQSPSGGGSRRQMRRWRLLLPSGQRACRPQSGACIPCLAARGRECNIGFGRRRLWPMAFRVPTPTVEVASTPPSCLDLAGLVDELTQARLWRAPPRFAASTVGGIARSLVRHALQV